MRYIIFPNYIISREDCQKHYIGYQKLIKLYGVPPYKCVNGKKPGYHEQDGDIHLHPKYDGNYNIEDKK